MKRARKRRDEMRADYGDVLDWSKGVRGKYYAAYTKSPPTFVVLEDAPAKPARRRRKAGG